MGVRSPREARSGAGTPWLTTDATHQPRPRGRDPLGSRWRLPDHLHRRTSAVSEVLDGVRIAQRSKAVRPPSLRARLFRVRRLRALLHRRGAHSVVCSTERL